MTKTEKYKELIKAGCMVSCPNCKTKFIVSSEQIEIECDCGEEFCAEDFLEDFIWHPSEKY